MTRSMQAQEVLDTIIMLAQQIARAAPECADQAIQIAELAAQLSPKADWLTIHDALEAEMMDCDLSDSEINVTTDAVIRAIRGKADPGS